MTRPLNRDFTASPRMGPARRRPHHVIGARPEQVTHSAVHSQRKTGTGKATVKRWCQPCAVLGLATPGSLTNADGDPVCAFCVTLDQVPMVGEEG